MGVIYFNTFINVFNAASFLANEGCLGGKDAQRTENSRAYNPDFKIANNSFKIVNGFVLGFGGEEILPFFISIS